MKITPNPKMKDVALRCGVAESTVSHVLNGTKFVAPETREKVERMLRKMNYHRDSHARRLARGHSDFLGLIISDIENPFYPGLIKAFEAAALEHGFEVLLCTTNYDPARTEHAIRKMIENKSPGVAIMTSHVDPALAQRLADHDVASVLLDSDGPGPLRSNIRLNYAQGAGAAVHYLYNLGHRRFALIAGPQDRASHVAYCQAIESPLEKLGLELKIVAGNNDVASGEAAAPRLLAGPNLPTAILCSNDLTALGALRALAKCGLQAPGDTSIVGADDIPFAALAQPPLTTVRMPQERLGRLALEILQTMLKGKSRTGRESVIDTELVIRESTAVPPAALSRRTSSPRGRAATRR